MKRIWCRTGLAIAVGLILSSSIAFADPVLAPPKSNNAPSDEPGVSKEVIVTPVPVEKSRYPEIEDGKYRDVLSQWGLDVMVSGSALGNNNLASGPRVKGINLDLEFQPKAFQGKFGIISFGPQFNIYPAIPSDADISSFASVWSVGANLRYQLALIRHQIIVPMVGYSYEHVSYGLGDVGNGSLSLAGPVFGLYVLLSDLDPMNAGELYILTGITRAYLAAEFKSLTGSDENLSLSGSSFYFGLRLEF